MFLSKVKQWHLSQANRPESDFYAFFWHSLCSTQSMIYYTYSHYQSSLSQQQIQKDRTDSKKHKITFIIIISSSSSSNNNNYNNNNSSITFSSVYV